MGFLEALRRVLTGLPHAPTTLPQNTAAPEPQSDKPYTESPTPGPDVYDRVQWHKKLKRILNELPGAQSEWPGLMTEARALGFDAPWIHHCQIEEFRMLVRQAVSDRHVTEEEHHRLDLARDLIGIPEAEAETILHAIVAEAEAFFGKPVEDS